MVFFLPLKLYNVTNLAEQLDIIPTFSFAHCEKNVIYKVCKWNKDTFTQLFFNKTKWITFQTIIKRQSIDNRASRTTYYHDEFGSRNSSHIVESSITMFLKDFICNFLAKTSYAFYESLHDIYTTLYT